jgi:hypothetical protein
LICVGIERYKNTLQMNVVLVLQSSLVDLGYQLGSCHFFPFSILFLHKNQAVIFIYFENKHSTIVSGHILISFGTVSRGLASGEKVVSISLLYVRALHPGRRLLNSTLRKTSTIHHLPQSPGRRHVPSDCLKTCANH